MLKPPLGALRFGSQARSHLGIKGAAVAPGTQEWLPVDPPPQFTTQLYVGSFCPLLPPATSEQAA